MSSQLRNCATMYCTQCTWHTRSIKTFRFRRTIVVNKHQNVFNYFDCFKQNAPPIKRTYTQLVRVENKTKIFQSYGRLLRVTFRTIPNDRVIYYIRPNTYYRLVCTISNFFLSRSLSRFRGVRLFFAEKSTT